MFQLPRKEMINPKLIKFLILNNLKIQIPKQFWMQGRGFEVLLIAD
jgi:hypothetical protein